jgi:hypothetical protein
MSEHSAPTASEPNAQMLQSGKVSVDISISSRAELRDKRENVLVHEAVVDQRGDTAVFEESPSVLGGREVRLAVERNLDAARARMRSMSLDARRGAKATLTMRSG